jgi:hypothetical protein
VAGELHHEVAGEAVGARDDDRALEHLGEPRTVADGIGAADRRVVELADDLPAVPA